MFMKKMVLGVAGGAALGLLMTSAALASTPVNIGTGTIGSAAYFDYVYPSTPDPLSPMIVAQFGATAAAAGAYSYDYTFELPDAGVGSGSISTSFAVPDLSPGISSVSINGTMYCDTTCGADTLALVEAGVNGVPISPFVENHIIVDGTFAGPGASYSGTVTFAASAAPEPATWALMIVGLGGMGLMLRRAKKTLGFGNAATA